jgi:hypothetical protein
MKIIKYIFIFLLFISFNSCEFIKKQSDLADQRRQRYTVDLKSPQIPIGEIEAQFNNLFPMPGIRTANIIVIYFPYEDSVCLNYRLNSITYHQFWHRAGRNAFIKAKDQYKADFENRKLRQGNNTRTKKQYGTEKEFYLYWQQLAQAGILTLASGNMDMELGYYFRDNSPFFSVTQLEAFYKSPIHDKDRDDSSPIIPIFFTLSQADELAALFNQDFLQTVSPIRQRQEPAVVVPDSY